MGQFHFGNLIFLFFAIIHAFILYFLVENVYSGEEGICEGVLVLLELGLVYDNFLLAIGSFMSKNSNFEPLSKFRFILHGSVLPSCFLILVHLLHRWFFLEYYYFVISYIFVSILIIHGTHVAVTEKYILTTKYGITRYTTKEFVIWNILPAILLTFCSIIVGIFEYSQQGSFYLLFGSITMFICAGLPRGAGFYASNFGEICLCLSYVLVVFGKLGNVMTLF